jgi:hypothetical protein
LDANRRLRRSPTDNVIPDLFAATITLHVALAAKDLTACSAVTFCIDHQSRRTSSNARFPALHRQRRGHGDTFDIDTYLAGTTGEGTIGYAKLVDVTTCTLALGADDLEMVAHRLMRYGMGERPGPVAMVVGSALNLDMAVLLKQRAGDRPFRIFTSIGAARSWLTGYQETYDPAAFATGLSTRVLRTA